MKQLMRTPVGNKEKMPFDIAPQVQQQQSQGDIEQALGDGGGGGASPHSVHQSVTGFDAEATTIKLKDLVRVYVQLTDDDVGELIGALASIAALAVLANHHDRESLGDVLNAGSGAGRLISAPSILGYLTEG